MQTMELETLLLGLERRVPQLAEDLSMLEREDDGEMYGVISLQLIENELLEIQRLMEKLNSTTLGHQRLSTSATEQVPSQHQQINTDVTLEAKGKQL